MTALSDIARRISPHFSWMELTTTSVRGIDNTPSPREMANLQRLCLTILEPLRREFGPWFVSSGYRSPAINRVIGGSVNSRHMDGLAVDGAPLNPALRWTDIVHWVAEHTPCDQVILEYNRWLHVGAALDGAEPRRQRLMIFSEGPGAGKFLKFDHRDARIRR